jgi:hypothetical protein
MNLAAEIPIELRDTLKQLTNTKKLLKRRIKLAGEAGDDSTVSQLTTDITKLSSGMALLVREMRAWEGKVRASVSVMTNEERIRVVIRFLEELPPGERVMFAEQAKLSKTLSELWNQPGQ